MARNRTADAVSACPEMGSQQEAIYEPLIIFFSFALFLSYHIHYWSHKSAGVLSYGNYVRRKVGRICVTSNSILGIQMLRNEIQHGTFLGSSVWTGLTIIISLSTDSHKLQCAMLSLARSDPLVGHYDSPANGATKILLLATLLAAAFAMTLQYLRILKHMNTMMACTGVECEQEVCVIVGELGMRASNFHFLAIRFLLASFVAIGLLFGATWGLLGSIVCISFLYVTDYLGKGDQDSSKSPCAYEKQLDKDEV